MMQGWLMRLGLIDVRVLLFCALCLCVLPFCSHMSLSWHVLMHVCSLWHRAGHRLFACCQATTRAFVQRPCIQVLHAAWWQGLRGFWLRFPTSTNAVKGYDT